VSVLTFCSLAVLSVKGKPTQKTLFTLDGDIQLDGWMKYFYFNLNARLFIYLFNVAIQGFHNIMRANKSFFGFFLMICVVT